MEAETFERALHLWPEWHDSITRSREELGYDAAWPVEKAVAWIESNYVGRLRPKGESELKRLNLPPVLQEYWEDCFYCDYRRPDGTVDFGKIRRRIAFEEIDHRGRKTGKWAPGNKSLPKLPYQASIVHYPGEDIHDPWLRIEIMVHGPLVTRDLLESALDQGWRSLSHAGQLSLPWGPHPLSQLIAKAKSNRSETKRRALERFQRGEVEFEGLMEEQWQTPEVQERLQRIMERYRHNSRELQKQHRALQKKVYDRVRRWFPEPKPKVKARVQWRQRLPLPAQNHDRGSPPATISGRGIPSGSSPPWPDSPPGR